MEATLGRPLRLYWRLYDEHGRFARCDILAMLDEIDRLRDEVLRLTSALGEWERGEREHV